MTWREDLRKVTITVNGKTKKLVGASFRGVPFFVDESDRGGGRRVVTHEFPLRDDPFREDLGRQARSFRVDGYVLGDDYLTQKDSLISALEDVSGPGQLLHPYYGGKSAICMTLSVRESVADGGMAQFSLEFGETPAQAPVPTVVANPADQVSDAADAAYNASKASLQSAFKTTGPSWSLESAVTALSNATAALRNKLGPIIATTQELATLNGQATLLVDEAESLVRTPSLILDQFHTAITSLVSTAESAPAGMMNALVSAYNTFTTDFGPSISPTTATRTQELANQTALVGALSGTIAIEAARLAPTVAFTTMDDALSARDQLGAIFDNLVENADDTAYPALVDLRSQVFEAVPGSSNFANVVTVARATALPSLLLAYQLYGAVDLEADIIARNDISNPAFIVGELKVLTGGG